MVAETDRSHGAAAQHIGSRLGVAGASWALRGAGRVLGAAGWLIDGLRRTGLSSLTRRILILNLAALVALAGGILFLNQFRAGLIDSRVASLRTQGQIIAAAIAAQSSAETNAITIDPDLLVELQAGESTSQFDVGEGATDFPINPEEAAPFLKRLETLTQVRARVYDQDGALLLDSDGLYSRGQIQRIELKPLDNSESISERVSRAIRKWFARSDLPIYREIGAGNGREYPEVASALDGQLASVVRVAPDGGMVVSVAVPIQRYRAVLGGLLLSTPSGDIDAIIHKERMAIFRVFGIAAGITVLLSFFLASTIAGPVRRLSSAAERVRRGVKKRVEIPDFGKRKDEIGDLAQSLRAMTDALYDRMDAIERFAADVAHELKNPLTSLRSAVETLPIAPTDDARRRLLAIIQHDVRRLDRLITDISDASRLDAEMAREDAILFDMDVLLETVTAIARETKMRCDVTIMLSLSRGKHGRNAFAVAGHDSRMGQVFSNLLDNAISFSPPDGTVRITAVRSHARLVVAVDDEGAGIRSGDEERIFDRFYTDRPDNDDFGQNSGLGLAISKQIVEAHRGTISAENRYNPDGSVAGARFTIVLPVAA